MSKALIIGNGPAGISAALYTARAGIETTVIARDAGALGKADKIENYYGFVEPIGGADLLERGKAQAKRLGVTLVEEEVVGLTYLEKLTVTTNSAAYEGDVVILATGSPRRAPKIEGLAAFEGAGVSYCAICDAFFYKGKDVAVLGCCEYAAHEAVTLLPLANSVTLLTNGETPMDGLPEGLKAIIPTKIKALTGDGKLAGVAFEDGTSISVSGLFVAQGVAGSADLARKIGAETVGNRIVVDEHMATNIPGLFAAGDCTGGMLQIAKAVAEGAEAGYSAVKYIRALR